MTDDNSALRIPIEINTSDLQEIQALIQDITEAESSIRELKPLKGKRSGTSRSAVNGLQEDETNDGIRNEVITSRSAVPNATSDRFGIFGVREEDATPLKSRDKSSRQAFQRESEFKKLREQVEDVRERQDIMGDGLNILTQASGFGSLLDNNKYGGVLKKFGGIASKAFLPIAVITIITELITEVVNRLLAPGGPFDRRFKRDLKNEIAAASDREEKIEIRQGVRVIRLTPFESYRGAGGERGLELYLKGKPQYDRNLELRSKGLTP